MNDTIIFHENKPLRDVCTLGIGGPARYFVEVKTKEQLNQAFNFIHEKKLPFFILGKGSNCLFDDKGFNGAVILNKIDFIEQIENTFHVGAGYSFSRLGTLTARKGYSGLEFASGIPGTVGGSVFMNAGANGKETCDTLIQVEFIDETGSIKRYNSNEMTFSYRTSIFQELKGSIISATFKLKKSENARKTQLDIISYRTKTQPYGDKSAGCMFRNPKDAHAGALIEQCGLKGTNIGETQVSNRHANFLINNGKGSSKDLLELIKMIKKQVKDGTGYTLETEVRYIPYE